MDNRLLSNPSPDPERAGEGGFGRREETSLYKAVDDLGSFSGNIPGGEQGSCRFIAGDVRVAGARTTD